MDYVKYKTDCLDKLKGFLTLEKKRPVLFIDFIYSILF